MSQRRRTYSDKPAWMALGMSAVIHIVVVAVLLPPTFVEWTGQSSEEHHDVFEVNTTIDLAKPDDPPPEPPPEKKPTKKVVEKEVDPPKPAPKQPSEPPKKNPQEIDANIDRKIVQQQTNEDMPDQADYLSKQANKVDEQTRARHTTTKNVQPSHDVPDHVDKPTGAHDEPKEADTLASRAQPAPEPRPRNKPQPLRPQKATEQQSAEPKDASKAQAKEGVAKAPEDNRTSPVIQHHNRSSDKKIPPQELLSPSAQDYEKVFGERDEALAGKLDEHPDGRKILEGWRDRQKQIRASLENFDTEVKPGNYTGVNAKPAVYAGYIGRMHRKIHALWGADYLPRLDTQYPPGHPLNATDLNTELEFVIDAQSGAMVEVNIVESSGQPMFDAEAVAIAYRIGPQRQPPGAIVSPDGKVYIHWNFWRDQRQCGPFGASILIVDHDKDPHPAGSQDGRQPTHSRPPVGADNNGGADG